MLEATPNICLKIRKLIAHKKKVYLFTEIPNQGTLHWSLKYNSNYSQDYREIEKLAKFIEKMSSLPIEGHCFLDLENIVLQDG